jgi:hypothetical protein
VDDLVKWLGEQLDMDAEVAHAASGGRTDGYRWVDSDRPAGAVATPWGGLVAREVTLHPHSEHIARHDPERVLLEVEAKRRILAAFQKADDAGPLVAIPVSVILLLALPYADRPGYREEWRP